MTLSEQDQAALQGHWLGQPLDEGLVRLLREDLPPDDPGRPRQLEVRRCLVEMASQTVRRTRRLGLAHGPLAVAQLVDLIRGESAETSRKAAVDLLRHWDSWARSELDAEAAALAAEHRRLTSHLTDQQVAQLWSILAEGRPSQAAKDASSVPGGADPEPLADPLSAGDRIEAADDEFAEQADEGDDHVRFEGT